jgi:IS5 family transposase
VQLAPGEGVTQGQKLRTDATVIETNRHYPTDSQLLSDSVRVLGRLLGHARRLLKPPTPVEKNVSQSQSARPPVSAQNRLCRTPPQRTKTN